MRYKFVVYRVLDAYVVIDTEMNEMDPWSAPLTRQLFTIPVGDLKVDDMLHLVEELYHVVAESAD